MESITLTLSGTSSILETQYYPPIELSSNKNYSLGLVELLTFNSIPNIDIGNNKFYIGYKVIVIPTGSYEISDIEKYLQKSVENTFLVLKPNNNTLRCEIDSSEQIDFTPSDSIGKLLGFHQRVLAANYHHISDLPVSITKINALRVECNITTGAYMNNKLVHTIHEFFPVCPPGYKIIEIPSQVIYLPVVVKCIDNIQLRIVNQDGDIVNFRGEIITIRLHIKTS